MASAALRSLGGSVALLGRLVVAARSDAPAWPSCAQSPSTPRVGAPRGKQLEPRHRTHLSLQSKRGRSPHYLLGNSP
jgi:hypothetical protein